MKVHWSNLTVLLLVVIAIWTWARFHREASGFLGMMAAIGPGHTADEQTQGLLAIGLIGVCIVSIVRLLTRNREE